jgi:NADPH-dependent ferric siderophore reductase
MPTLPKWINDAMEGLLRSHFRPVVAIHVEDYSSSLRKIQFQGDFAGLAFEPGYATAFRVSDTAYRNYTPFRFDAKEGICEILFHLHGNGPGSDFMRDMRTGEVTRMLLPRGRTVYRGNVSHHVVIGDETSLGLALAIQNETVAQGHSFNAIFELNDRTVMEELELYGHVLTKDTLNKAGRIRQHIFQQNEDAGANLQNTGFYVAGNADTMRMARRELKEMNVPAKNIFSQAYWAEGKTGL